MAKEEERDIRVEYRGTGFYVGVVAILFFAVALLVLAAQNTQEVEVDFFGLQLTVPLFAVAIGAALLGVVLDELVGLVWRRLRRIRLEERAELSRLRAAEARPTEEGAEIRPRSREADAPAERSVVDVGEPEQERSEGSGNTESP